MSIALERSNSGGVHRIEGAEFVHRDTARVSSIFDTSEFSASPEEDRSGSLSSSATSSIGKNSDEHPGSGSDEEEVQSEYTGGPLDSLDSLEEVLPIKKSISSFYSGKSKSFTSLSDAALCPSIQEITKPENAYTRKRKNLLAFNYLWEKNHNSISRNHNGGISKRSTNSRSMLTLAANANGCESNSEETSNSSSPGRCLPPLPPQARRNMSSQLSSLPPADRLSSWRSFSLSDLHGAAAAAAPSSTGLRINGTDKYSNV
ncbi:hypothetical protein ACS0TY_033867 [Phlomoides rotata]